MSSLKPATVAAFEVDSTPGNLNGLKTVIGVLLIAAAHSLDAINDLVMVLPDLSWVDSARFIIGQITEYGELLLELIGSGFLSVGLIDKVKKFIRVFVGNA